MKLQLININRSTFFDGGEMVVAAKNGRRFCAIPQDLSG
jgi:hypothetical protein